jgi:hypothetical protein
VLSAGFRELGGCEGESALVCPHLPWAVYRQTMITRPVALFVFVGWIRLLCVFFCLQAKAPLKTVKPSRPPSPYKNERHSEKDTFECKFFFVLFLLLPKLNIFVVIYERERLV